MCSQSTAVGGCASFPQIETSVLLPCASLVFEAPLLGWFCRPKSEANLKESQKSAESLSCREARARLCGVMVMVPAMVMVPVVRARPVLSCNVTYIRFAIHPCGCFRVRKSRSCLR